MKGGPKSNVAKRWWEVWYANPRDNGRACRVDGYRRSEKAARGARPRIHGQRDHAQARVETWNGNTETVELADKRAITSVRITKYLDNGQTVAWVSWGNGGTTMGEPDGVHMQCLIARFVREGGKVVRDTAGWLPEAA